MMHQIRLGGAALLTAALLAGAGLAADLKDGFQKGTPELKSVGAMAFGPEGILFAADPLGAAIYAIDTGDSPKEAASSKLNVKGIDEKIASLIGAEKKDIQIKDLEVNPASGTAYLSVMRGKGKEAAPLIVRVDQTGTVKEVRLKDVMFSKVELPNPPGPTAKPRLFSITKLAYVKGKLYVSGLSNEEWKSTLRAIPFPFKEADKGTSVQIWHGAHGRFETEAPIRTFISFEIEGKAHLLAAYTCTPLVKIPVSDLVPGKKLKGTTIAELGNRNQPLDMFAYEKDGKKFILIANSSRGLMKVSTEDIAKVDPVTAPVKDGKTAGLTYETIKEYKGVQQLDQLDKEHALLLIRGEEGGLNLQTIDLP